MARNGSHCAGFPHYDCVRSNLDQADGDPPDMKNLTNRLRGAGFDSRALRSALAEDRALHPIPQQLKNQVTRLKGAVECR